MECGSLWSPASSVGLLWRSNLGQGTPAILACKALPQPSRSCISFTHPQESSFRCYPRACLYLGRSKHQILHVLPLQAVTMENDPQGSDPAGPSSSMEYSSVPQGSEAVQKSLSEWFLSLQMKIIKATRPNNFKGVRLLQEAKDSLLNLDRKHVFEELRIRKLHSFAMDQWQNTQLWIKWPAVIFVSWYSIITILYGSSVSNDLVPLWILGPLGTAFIMKSSIELVAFSRYLVTYVCSTQLASWCVQLYEDTRTGQLPLRIERLSQSVAKKKSEIVLYLESGQFVMDVRLFFLKKLHELRDQIAENYDDFRDWLRVLWLRLSRILSKYF